MKNTTSITKDVLIIKTKPISVNALYRGGRRFLTREGRETKESMEWELRQQWKKPIIFGEVKVTIDFYFKDKRMDIDNAVKSLLDCMSGICWKDDRQIVELIARKHVNKSNPSILISIENLSLNN